ncbi:ABC transporter ATP-binding protein [uncultured Roseobacter sp.]|uniref:ABC transporter ATP-binding protein n=1 Tax=uncultured Roseobacter sp. TaxID=114847 RepID=UPI002607B78F|nr:ABC transporter ATP-binding protein [uncultured Roseobacter sp.]
MRDLVLSGIRKDYGRVRAVDSVDLRLAEGQLTALLGPSGCGKTTLLRMIAGLETPSAGRILLGADNLTDRPAHKRKFGMVFQNFALFPHLTVRDNVCYALSIDGVPRAKAHARAEELLALVQLEGFGDRRIGALSGGQRQRVAIARALAQEPEVFLLDEPMSALDANLRETMQVELRMLQQRLGITTVVVTHDQREAMTMADRIVVMSDGLVEQIGTPQEIYHQPQNAFVADFIGRANFFDGVAREGSIDVAGLSLRAQPLNFTPGAPVRVAIRPERVQLGESLPDGNRIPAEVVFLRDVGATRDIHLATPLGTIIAEEAIGTGARRLDLGTRVEVNLPPEALHVFPAATHVPQAA